MTSTIQWNPELYSAKIAQNVLVDAKKHTLPLTPTRRLARRIARALADPQPLNGRITVRPGFIQLAHGTERFWPAIQLIAAHSGLRTEVRNSHLFIAPKLEEQ